MDTSKLSDAKRQQRNLIRSTFLIATIDEMVRAKDNYDAFGQEVLEEMIQTCLAQGVDNFGDTTE